MLDLKHINQKLYFKIEKKNHSAFCTCCALTAYNFSLETLLPTSQKIIAYHENRSYTQSRNHT